MLSKEAEEVSLTFRRLMVLGKLFLEFRIYQGKNKHQGSQGNNQKKPSLRKTANQPLFLIKLRLSDASLPDAGQGERVLSED